ncbi:SusC/RagA family TonB-linked outer membrane protein [Chitinophaga pinensis]|nr:TonB-dependent receptor [Chitinophaga pinensis]
MHQKFTHCYATRSLMGILCLLLPCIQAVAQKSTQPGRNVTLTSSRIALGDVFNVIEKQTGVLLFFGDLNTNQTVGVKFVATPVEVALGEMLPPIGLTYEYVKGNKDKIFIKSIMPSKKDTVMMTSISGVVTDEKGEPLPGASVRVKGTNVGTATERNGSFTLRRNSEKDVLQVSFMGFTMAEIPVGGKANVKVRLRQEENSLQVVTAYGTTEKRAVTGAMTIVKGADIQNLPNRSFDKSLMGVVPGLLVTPGTGQPGGGIANFVLRGIATSADPRNGSTVRNPLILIDGIPVSQETTQMSFSYDSYTTSINNPLAQLNPSDIESISVLKDASAIALYGAKASNGVILITSKRGKAGKTRFEFRHQTDISKAISNRQRTLTQDEYLKLLYETYKNTDPIKWTDQAIKSDLFSKFSYRVNGNDTIFYPAADWRKELYNDVAPTISNELSASGGNDNTNFFLNFEYTKQNGVIRGTGYDRKSVRFNFENRPTKWLRLGLNNFLSYNVQNYAGSAGGAGDMDAAAIALMSPLNPIRLDNGDFQLNYAVGGSSQNQVNPAAALAYNTNKNTAYRALTKVSAEVSFLKNFKITSNLGVDFMFSEAKEKVDTRLSDPLTLSIGGKIEEQDVRRANIINTNMLNYNQIFSNIHELNLIVGQEAQIMNQRTMAVAVGNLGSFYYDQISSPGATIMRQSGYVLKETLLSYFAQLNYGFGKKYFLTGTIRKDGSSRFGADKRFGTYWSTGIGWVMTSEDFMSTVSQYLNYLKIRGSIGAAGNAGAINRFTPYDQSSIAKYQNATAVYTSTPGNPDVKWENTLSWDAGVEGSIIKNRVSFTADIYQRNTSNLIYTINLPLSSGFSSMLGNLGKMRNRGVEISLSTDVIKTKQFTWNINANWSTNRNTLVKADVPLAATVVGPTANKEGESFNSFYAIKWAGVNPSSGNSQWLDSVGKPNEDPNAAKRVIIGQTQPKAFGSITCRFNWKAFDLSSMFYYQYGYLIYDDSRFVNDGYSPYSNQGVNALDRWQNPGDIASNPKRLLSNALGGATIYSSRFLFSGDYIRLQNVVVGYTCPESITQKLRISGARIFVQGSNLALWSSSPALDPATVNVAGFSSTSYPMQRSISVGLNAKF